MYRNIYRNIYRNPTIAWYGSVITLVVRMCAYFCFDSVFHVHSFFVISLSNSSFTPHQLPTLWMCSDYIQTPFTRSLLRCCTISPTAQTRRLNKHRRHRSSSNETLSWRSPAYRSHCLLAKLFVDPESNLLSHQFFYVITAALGVQIQSTSFLQVFCQP